MIHGGGFSCPQGGMGVKIFAPGTPEATHLRLPSLKTQGFKVTLVCGILASEIFPT